MEEVTETFDGEITGIKFALASHLEIKPDLVIFVMDSSNGQAALDQGQAFKQSVAIGAVIITKRMGMSREVVLLMREVLKAKEHPAIVVGVVVTITFFHTKVKRYVMPSEVQTVDTSAPGKVKSSGASNKLYPDSDNKNFSCLGNNKKGRH